jgi:hypothetical protein
VGCTQALAGVAVEVLVEEEQVPPVRVVLELLVVREDGASRKMPIRRRLRSSATSARVIRRPEPVGCSTVRSGPK